MQPHVRIKKYSGRIFLFALFLVVLFKCNYGSKNKNDISKEENLAFSNIDKKKPRLLILTDIGGDPDDQQSLVRLLVYSNGFDIEGIVVEGWKKYSGYDQMGLAQSVLSGYGRVRDNLLQHKRCYPTEEYLQGVLKRGAVDVEKPDGNVKDYVGEGKDTEGSRHIVSVLEKDDPRILNISVWGGTADLAQALWWLRENRSAEELNNIISGVRIHAIGHQDITGPWILENFPGLFYILSLSPDGKKLESVYRGMYLDGDEQLTSSDWVNENIRKDNNYLGQLYPVKTHTQKNPHGALKEGDTPAWFYFYKNGLNDPSRPEFGGWGGRFKALSGYFNDTEDKIGDVSSARATVWRWRPHFQNDFQARMDWCIKSYEEANHNPVAVINEDNSKAVLEISASPGDTVPLNANGSKDPDGDILSYNWYVYEGAGTYKKPVLIAKANEQEATLTIPEDASTGETVHVILEVTDDGDPVLYSYRRIIITVNELLAFAKKQNKNLCP